MTPPTDDPENFEINEFPIINFTNPKTFKTQKTSFFKLADDISKEQISKAVDLLDSIRIDKEGTWEPSHPSSDSRIWRYLNFTQLQSILERDKIWFTNVTQFNDPYEGTVPQKNIEDEIEEIVEETGIGQGYAEEIHRQYMGTSYVKGGYVNCWNINPHESAALWEQYLDSPQGIAICTTVEQLEQSLHKSDRDLIFGEVEYIDYKRDRIPDGKLPPLYHKRKSFEHEDEFRVSFIESEPGDVGVGTYIGVDTETLIDRIYLSPLSQDWFGDLVDRVLDTYDVDCDLQRSGLYSNPAY